MKSFQKRIPDRLFLVLITFLLVNCGKSSQPAAYVTDIKQARSVLAEQRTQVLEDLQQKVTPQNLERLVDLGLWKKAQTYLDGAGALNSEMKLVQAELWMKRHRYAKAEKLVNQVLAANSKNRKAQLLRADLYIQSWNLAKADSIAKVLLNEDNQDAEAGWIRGRVTLLKRDYEGALKWAQKIQDWESDNAAGFLLEAQSQFWAQNPMAAESALVRALELDPFNADARFSYGYAIWRRVDATQLDEMAGQWNFVLEINPLHYLTHWHFGNGHTNLTYADYAEPSDSLVQARLDKADQLVAQEKPGEAIALTRKIGQDFPQSVIPAMMRGSFYYMYYSMDRSARLDSAGAIFRHILEQKQNYGPAHNGLAAVIKQRQFSYLDGFEKLEQAIKNTKMPEKDVFYKVFPDLNYYPGERVAKMVAQQLGPSQAYLPMINALGRDFQLPPLHHNLAEAMGNNYFLYGTTFDNRQWMDIRGVGSGATGIEYIERGSHWERNVLAHEYAHLYHGRILTDKESRRIRALYNAAMKNNRTLDYYSANNESEFFAQAYAAFLSEKKVHPLTHKSMNTRDYLRRKDPALYAYVDSLVQKQKAYLSGDEEVFDSNWAQTYLTLAQDRGNTPAETRQYLDKALSYDEHYIPALLAYARVEARSGQFDEARAWITQAQKLNRDYAPAYIAEAFVWHQKALKGDVSFEASLKQQVPLFEKALKLEDDLSVRARINQKYRNRSLDYGQVAKAVEIGERYVEDAPTISTYLRDRKDEAMAFVKSIYSNLGYAQKNIPFFADLVQQKPQHFGFRLMYADALMQAGKPDEAMHILKEGHKILSAANDERPGYLLRIAKVYLKKDDTETAKKWLEQVSAEQLSFQQKLMLAELYLTMNEIEKAVAALPESSAAEVPNETAALTYVKAMLQEAKGNLDKAVKAYHSVLALNPYHLKARARLVELLQALGESDEAQEVKQQGESLAIPPGPDVDI